MSRYIKLIPNEAVKNFARIPPPSNDMNYWEGISIKSAKSQCKNETLYQAIVKYINDTKGKFADIDCYKCEETKAKCQENRNKFANETSIIDVDGGIEIYQVKIEESPHIIFHPNSLNYTLIILIITNNETVAFGIEIEYDLKKQIVYNHDLFYNSTKSRNS